ncbi:helix-turn-helix transcriptional regulator [bacterium]|nr:helix-turn-helix transcriptional regulator [bacterium]
MEFQDYYIKIGKRIKQLREQNSLTQEQLATRADISLDYLGKIEVNINKPGLKSIFKIAKALNVEPKSLLEFNNL